MSDTPIYDALRKSFVRTPFVPPQPSQTVMDSRQLNEYHEGQVQLDEENFKKSQKKAARRKKK